MIRTSKDTKESIDKICKDFSLNKKQLIELMTKYFSITKDDPRVLESKSLKSRLNFITGVVKKNESKHLEPIAHKQEELIDMVLELQDKLDSNLAMMREVAGEIIGEVIAESIQTGERQSAEKPTSSSDNRILKELQKAKVEIDRLKKELATRKSNVVPLESMKKNHKTEIDKLNNNISSKEKEIGNQAIEIRRLKIITKDAEKVQYELAQFVVDVWNKGKSAFGNYDTKTIDKMITYLHEKKMIG